MPKRKTTEMAQLIDTAEEYVVPTTEVAEVAVEDTDVMSRLMAPLRTQERIIGRTRTGENILGQYFPISECIKRLREVFGLNLNIVFHQPTIWELKNRWLISVHCRIEVLNPDGTVASTVDGFGSYETDDHDKNLENALKIASSTAIKRASLLLGIGLYLYEEDTVRFEPTEKPSNNQPVKTKSFTANSTPSAKNKANNEERQKKADALCRRVYDMPFADVYRELKDEAEVLDEFMSEKQFELICANEELFEMVREETDDFKTADKQTVRELISDFMGK